MTFEEPSLSVMTRGDWMAHSDDRLIAHLALGLPPGPGVTIRTDTPIDGTAPSLTTTVDLTLKLPDGSLFTLHYPPMELRLPNQSRWDGYRVELFGIQRPEPPTGWMCSTWTMHEAEDLPAGLPALGTIPLLRQWVRYQDAPIYAQVLQFPGLELAKTSFQVVGPSYTMDDLRKASEGLDLLRQFKRAHHGRRPLEEDDESGWRETTLRAIKYKKDNPHLEWKVVAGHFSVSERQLREWRRRLRSDTS